MPRNCQVANCANLHRIDDSSCLTDFDLGHVRGLTGCSLFAMQPWRQPGGPHLADGLEKVELVVRGRCWALDGGVEREAGAGTIIWHLPGDRLISRSDERDPYACLVVTWATAGRTARRVPRFARWEDRGELLAFVRQLLAAYADERIDRRVLALASYGQLQWRAHAWAATGADPALPDPLRRLVAALEAEPARPWPVAGMAAVAGCSPSRLHALFRQYLRRSPHQHLLELRLRRVRALLGGPRLPLAAIAQRTGLGSAAALCRHFRRQHGISPGDWRARQF